MARPIRKSLSDVGVTAPIPLNWHNNPFQVSFAVDIGGGTMTYTVQHTYDDVFASDFNPATATWFPNDVVAAASASDEGNYVVPITAIRLNVTAHTSGTATLTVIQAGIGGN